MKKSRLQRHSRRRRGGFTLIEVLLVLVILVIISSIASLSYFAAMRSANVKAAQAQIGLLKSPLSLYYVSFNAFPTTEQGLAALSEPPSDLADEDQWDGPYLDQEIPQDPWGNTYQYESPGNHNADYDIWSYGPDGIEGTEDDIGNWTEE